MATGPWKVKVTGIVSRRVEGLRFPVSEGTWDVKSLPDGRFRFSSNFEDPFELTALEISTYLRARAISFVAGEWP